MLAAGVLLGFADLIRIGALVTALPALAAVLTRRRGPSLVTWRHASPAAITLGQPARVTVTVRNDGSAPSPPMPVEEHVSYSLGDRTRTVLGRIGPGATQTVDYGILPNRRGRHRLGPLVLHRRDPFGLASRAVVVPGTLEVVALPVIHRLTGLPTSGGEGVEGTTPTLVSRYGGEDNSIRGYQIGDDLRRIHWPVTAHRGTLMVRHEGRPSLRRAVLVIDTHGMEATPVALDWAVEALASVAAHLGAEGYALHVVTPLHCRTVHPETMVDTETAIRALAVVDAHPEPVLPGQPEPSAEPGDQRAHFLSDAREVASRGGLVVAAASYLGGDRAHDILGITSMTSVGMLFLLGAELDGHRGQGADAGVGDHIAGLARSGGWHTARVRAGDGVETAWHALRSGRVIA